jgi:hypothetical protein
MARPKGSKNKKPAGAVSVGVVSPYKVTITNGTEQYIGKGESIVEAFQNVPFEKTFFPLNGSVRVEHDGKSEEKHLFPRQVKLLMHNKIKRTMWARLFSYTL